jgi:hypothetical protein
MSFAKRVDHSITDPPYTGHVHANIQSVHSDGVRKWDPGFDPMVSYTAWRVQLAITRRWTLNFCALEQFGLYEQEAGGFRKAGGHYVRSWIWRKGQAAPQMSGNCPGNSCEGIAVAHARGLAMRWHGRGSHAWWDGPLEDFDETYCDNVVFSNRDRAIKRHPTQKPGELCDQLINKFTDPGELVGDWYCGSGAIAAAAVKAGRKVIACDNNLLWAAYTALRLSRIDRGDLSLEPLQRKAA